MSIVLESLKLSIAKRLVKIEDLLPATYKLTLVARNTAMKDADIVMTADDLSAVVAVIEHLKGPEHIL